MIRSIFALGLVTITGCEFVAGDGTGYGYGGCDQYGQVCEGESFEAGAFEAVIVPFADSTYGVTVTVTFEDAAAGDDIVVTQDLYADYNGEYWFYSPSAPPDGRVYVEVQVYLQYDYSVDGVCNDAPQADLVAYNNGYEIGVDYRGSSPCYAQTSLRDIVD